MRKIICDYCGGISRFVDSATVYGISYGMIYYCDKCHAWVGAHKGTDIPLGCLANSELRKERRAAHASFDRLWRGNRHISRSKAYHWLSLKMGLPESKTHIGMFNLGQCRQVIEICNKRLEERNHVK